MKINNYVWENDLSLNDLVLKQKEKIDELQNKLQQKENIIKEVREKVNRYPEFNYSNDYMIFRNEIKEILDKGVN